MNRFSILVLVFLCSCNVNNNEIPKDQRIRSVLSYTLDSIINQELNHFDVCGLFLDELTDEQVKKSLGEINNIISEEDKEFILKQYNNKKGKDAGKYINMLNYDVKKGFKYYPKDSINYHLTLSCPLFTLDKNYAVLFTVGRTMEVESSVDGFYFLLKKSEDDSWELIDVFKNEYTKPKSETHDHPYSFAPIS